MTAVEEKDRSEPVFVSGADGTELVGCRLIPPQNERGTVVLLHGGGQTRHSWYSAAKRLADAGWQTITMDARGHGDSQWSSSGDYSLDAFVGDIYAIADVCDSAPVLVGASMGGRAALVAAGENPCVSAGLVLVDVAHRVDQQGQQQVRDFMSAGKDGFTSLEQAAASVDRHRPARTGRRNIGGLRKNLRQHADERWYWHWDPRFLESTTNVLNYDVERLSGAARNITVPTLLVRGRHSNIVSAADATELRELIPSAELVEVDAGHMISGDDNDVFTKSLIRFLGSVASSR